METDEKPSQELPQTEPRSTPDIGRNAKLRAQLSAEVKLDHVYFIMLFCCLITGFVDGTLYNAFSTFVSMQTGNTIFLALGASGQNTRPYGWARSLMSIACFIFGSFFFSRLGLHLGPRRRGTLTLSFLIQALLILIAASLIQGSVIRGSVPFVTTEAIHWNQLAPIALLSFQSAGQIVSSRAANVGEIPTVVITSLLCDLFSDPVLFACPVGSNPKRNKRATAFVLTLVGAIVGGWVSKATGSVEAMLWIAGGCKLIITGLWMVWPAKDVVAV